MLISLGSMVNMIEETYMTTYWAQESSQDIHMSSKPYHDKKDYMYTLDILLIISHCFRVSYPTSSGDSVHIKKLST